MTWFGLLAMFIVTGIYVGTNHLSRVPMAARSKCPPVAGFHELRIG